MTARLLYLLRQAVMLFAGALAAGALFAPSPTIAAERQPATAAEQLVSNDQIGQTIKVVDVSMQGGMVSGKLVNTSGDTLRDVKLIIDQSWLWNNERHPGSESPGRTDFYMVPEIPPHGTVTLQYRSPVASVQRTDGRFTARVMVESFTQVGS